MSKMQVSAAIQTPAEMFDESMPDAAILDFRVRDVVATLVRENLRILAEDLSWVPNETRVGDDYLEVRLRLSLDDLEAAMSDHAAKMRKAFETARGQVTSLLEE